jgi:6-pyruvoyl-tetrahydropterin synthase
MSGKCEQIHGHSMHVELLLEGYLGPRGVIHTYISGQPLEFGQVKKAFREFLDITFDHHLLLNENDPFARPLRVPSEPVPVPDIRQGLRTQTQYLPGLQPMPGDPTTENIALWIGQWALEEFKCFGAVQVNETDVNAIRVPFGQEYSHVD